ncbi:hypothetical protein [Treponema brennaborense]|uniref:hypothetical protein n=1 Tax=Treponema brennaborense TaxID=81028 RepID=UPI00059F8056|nr:hypothetical protein [Treponema brennaborense]
MRKKIKNMRIFCPKHAARNCSAVRRLLPDEGRLLPDKGFRPESAVRRLLPDKGRLLPDKGFRPESGVRSGRFSVSA